MKVTIHPQIFEDMADADPETLEDFKKIMAAFQKAAETSTTEAEFNENLVKAMADEGIKDVVISAADEVLDPEMEKALLERVESMPSIH